jgi:hypothetical protein
MSTKTVHTSLNYFSPPADGSKPYTLINAPDPASGQRQRNWDFNEQEVEIEDIRGNEASVSLDTAGYHFGVHPAKHSAFLDDKEIQNEYYPESIELIKSVTGASRVVLFDHSEHVFVHQGYSKANNGFCSSSAQCPGTARLLPR